MMKAHLEAAPTLTRWYMITRRAQWDNLGACRMIFADADQVGRCLIFNVMGGNYRLIVVVAWPGQRCYLKAQ